MPNFEDCPHRYKVKEVCKEKFDKLCLKIDLRIDKLETLINEKFLQAEKALAIAEKVMERKTDHMNAVREQLVDQARMFPLKAAVDLEIQHLKDLIDPLTKKANKEEGALSVKVVILSIGASLFVAWAAHTLFKF